MSFNSDISNCGNSCILSCWLLCWKNVCRRIQAEGRRSLVLDVSSITPHSFLTLQNIPGEKSARKGKSHRLCGGNKACGSTPCAGGRRQKSWVVWQSSGQEPQWQHRTPDTEGTVHVPTCGWGQRVGAWAEGAGPENARNYLTDAPSQDQAAWKRCFWNYRWSRTAAIGKRGPYQEGGENKAVVQKGRAHLSHFRTRGGGSRGLGLEEPSPHSKKI